MYKDKKSQIINRVIRNLDSETTFISEYKKVSATVIIGNKTTACCRI